MHFVKTLVLGITVAAAAPGLYAQAKPAAPAAAKPAPQAAKPADKTAAKPVAQMPAKPAAAAATGQNKPAAASAKPATPTTGMKAGTQAAKPATPGSKKAPKQTAPKTTKPAASARSSAGADKEPKVAKRDPFESLVGREHAGASTQSLPAGKAGLQVSTLRLDGVVRAPSGMIAVVSNPQSRTYFLRDGDQLFDGRVEKIAMDGVSFHEVGKDAFGKPVERQVNKRIYASAGEQQ